MKRFSPFLFALLLVPVWPSAALAADGLTQYTQRVLERARTALEQPLADGGTTWETEDKMAWVNVVVSQILVARKTETTRAVEGERLPRETACLRTDLLVIESEMEKVRGLLWEAYRKQSFPDIFRLGKIYAFLDEHRTVLIRGALLPGYADPNWSIPTDFDTDEEKDRIKNERLCPYSTKYFDVSLDQAYGCTPDVLDEASAILSSLSRDGASEALGAEREALRKLIDKLREESLIEEGDSGSFEGRSQEEGCVETWPADFRAWSPGRFQEVPGERFLSLLDVLWNLERLRPAPLTSTSLVVRVLGLLFLNPELNRQAEEFSKQQTQLNSTIRGGVLEAEGIEDAYSPLTRAVGKLSRLAHDAGGSGEDRSLRDFTIDMAYFLRRSCMTRSCNAVLERIIKIANADSCFPYTNGDGDIPANATEEERQKKIDELTKECKTEAKVDKL